jgi:AraC family transcriptional regulator, ethanolamine operon transcriptional activator
MATDLSFEPRAWMHGGHFSDVDAQAAQLHGYGQQYLQLSRGPFEGQFRSFIFGDDLGIHFEMANRVLAQSASTPPGRYAACLLSEISPPCAMNAGVFSQNHVALCPERESLEGKTAEGVSLCCIDLSYELVSDGEFHMRNARVVSDAARSGQLRNLIRSGVATFTALQNLASYPAAIKGFKSSLADLLCQMSAHSSDRDVKTTNPYATTRTLHVFRRARDCIHDGLADGISIVTLCRDLGVSRRSLEYVFRSVVGMGPGNYARTLQLNHIRRDLISDTGGDVSIGAIAARRGVWHWSRFSQHYRLLFGELPSQTRLRHGAHGPAASRSLQRRRR